MPLWTAARNRLASLGKRRKGKRKTLIKPSHFSFHTKVGSTSEQRKRKEEKGRTEKRKDKEKLKSLTIENQERDKERNSKWLPSQLTSSLCSVDRRQLALQSTNSCQLFQLNVNCHQKVTTVNHSSQLKTLCFGFNYHAI